VLLLHPESFHLRRVKKYFYNTTTHRFEKLIVPVRTRLLRLLGFLSASTVTALIMVAIAYRFLPSPNEKRSKAEMQQLTEQYDVLQQNLNSINKSVAALEDRDDGIYRAIFESSPIPDSLREGKSYTAQMKQYAYTPNEKLIAQMQQEVSALRHRITVQQRSYDTLEHLVKAKEKMLASIPAIQPLSNKDLSHIASGFGYRIDPIYKTPKLHTGLDFAAPMGTPIYATADGTVTNTSFDDGGYGNHVIINHGYGYQTLYGHMVRIKIRQGEQVKRGQVIGWVGSTGKSTGPHCHYEVIRNANKIDPVHYFFNDLSATDYERLVRIAAANNQSFD
jgi:murein DD-endopeptidase MepM/ murein hydrolase activator NlpD